MKPLHVAIILFAFLENITFSGLLMGWGAMQYVLENLGYYNDLCEFEKNNGTLFPTFESSGFGENVTLSLNTTQSENMKNERYVACPEKDEMFFMIYAISLSIEFLTSSPAGYLLDRYGPWVLRTISTFMITSSLILIAASRIDTSWLLFVATTFMGSGGIYILMCNIQLGNLAKHRRGFVITFLHGAYQTGSLFFIVKLITDTGTDFYTVMYVLASLSSLLWVKTYFLTPKENIPFPLDKDYHMELLCSKARKPISTTEAKISLTKDEPRIVQTSIKTKIKTGTFKTYLCSLLYISNLFHFGILAFRVTFYTGSLIPWLSSFKNEESVSNAANMCAIMFLFSFVTAPFNGILTDFVVEKFKAKGKRTAMLSGQCASMFATSLLCVLLSVSVIAKSTIVSSLFFILAQSFLFGGNASYISFLFPPRHFGKLFGITQLIAAIATIMEYIAFKTALKYDSSFVGTSYFMLGISLSSFIHPCFLVSRVYSRKTTEINNNSEEKLKMTEDIDAI